MDPPGRVNNPYKERIVVEPAVEVKSVTREGSQGCKFARSAGYGTLEYCTQSAQPLQLPPRYFQLDYNIEKAVREISPTSTNNLPWILALIFIAIIIWRS